MSHGRFDNPVSAVLAGVADFFRPQALTAHLKDSDRIEGKNCLVTGANRGLGLAIAKELAQRGGHVIMACRSGIPEAGDIVKQATVSDAVETFPLNLSDIDSIHTFCDELEARQIKLDIIVLNAGVTPPRSRQTKTGLDEMFMVNYLANFILMNRLIKTRVISKTEQIPRILVISSDSHQGASAIEYESLGEYTDYGVRKAINNYSYFKLAFNTFAAELSRRLNSDAVNISINIMCPGPVNTDIIRDAPFLLRMFMRLIFLIFFQSPKKAAKPVAYLCCSEEFAGKTCEYLHMFNPKKMDEKVYDETAGRMLWKSSTRLWRRIDPQSDDFLL